MNVGFRVLILNRSLRAWQESNLRPSGPEPDALSPELHALAFAKCIYTSTA